MVNFEGENPHTPTHTLIYTILAILAFLFYFSYLNLHMQKYITTNSFCKMLQIFAYFHHFLPFGNAIIKGKCLPLNKCIKIHKTEHVCMHENASFKSFEDYPKWGIWKKVLPQNHMVHTKISILSLDSSSQSRQDGKD